MTPSTPTRPTTVAYSHPSRADRGVVTHRTLAAAYRHAVRLSLAGYGARIGGAS